MLDPRAVSLFIGAMLFCAWLFSAIRISYWVKIPFLYFLVHSAYGFLSPWYYPSYLQGYTLPHIMKMAGMSFSLLAGMTLIFYMMPKNSWTKIFDFILIFLAIDAVVLQFSKFGLMNTHSFDTTVMALMIPFCLFTHNKRWHKVLALAFFLTILQSGTTAFIVLLAPALVYLLRVRGQELWLLVFIAGAALIKPFIGSMYGHPEAFWYASGRYEAWKSLMLWWAQYANPFFGVGAGSFEVLGPFLKVGNMSLILMHNDYLQVLFEYGIVGLIMFMVLCGRIIYRSWEYPKLFTMTIGYAIAMMTYFPTHFLISQIIGMYLIISAERKK